MATVNEKDTEEIVLILVAPILRGSWSEEDQGQVSVRPG